MKIKFTTATCLLILICHLTNAQKYESCFGEKSTSWVIVNPTSWWGIEENVTPNYYNIDSTEYYGWYNETQKDGLLFYESNNNSELWRWDLNSNEKQLLMNLNWKVGDTIFFKTEYRNFTHYLPYNRDFAIVDSVYINDNKRKVIHTDIILGLDNFDFNLEYIEGVGPNASIFLLEEGEGFWGNNLLLCAYKDDVWAYSDIRISEDCTYPKPAGIEETKLTNEVDFTHYEETLAITASETFSGILCLINTDGQTVLKKELKPLKQSFSTEMLPEGIYVVQITNRHKQIILTKKFMKY